MCEHCEKNDQFCPECGRMVCDDLERGGDDIIAASFVTRYGDWMCWFCGVREEDEFDRQEEEEAAEFGWEYPHDWYDPDVPVPDDEDPPVTYIGPDDPRLG